MKLMLKLIQQVMMNVNYIVVYCKANSKPKSIGMVFLLTFKLLKIILQHQLTNKKYLLKKITNIQTKVNKLKN